MKILTLNDAIWVIRNTIAEGSLRDTIELRLEEKATEPSGDLISREEEWPTCDCCGAPLGKIFDERKGKYVPRTFSCEYCGATYLDMTLAKEKREQGSEEE